MLTVKQFAEKETKRRGRSLKERRVLDLIHDGRIPATRFGHAWMIEDNVTYEPKPVGRPRKGDDDAAVRS